MENYFDRPKQVVFADPDNPGEWIVGIAYKDEIICACCGGIFDIDDVIGQAKLDGRRCAIYPYEDWIDVASEISGGECPNGLELDDNHNVIEVEFTEVEYDTPEEENEIEGEEYDAYYFRNLE